jgi:hypothetical protein
MRDIGQPKPSMRDAMAVEAEQLPKWRRKRKRVTLADGSVADFTQLYSHTHSVQTYGYGRAEVDLLRWLVTRPDAMTALRRYEQTHQRALQGKRKALEADPDVVDTSWRQRTPRYLSAEDLIRSQFSGRALARELRRIL